MSVSQKEPCDVNSYSATFINGRGKKIFCKYWEPKESPRALVFIAHGFAEHCLPYDPLAKTLVSHNYFVFAHDHVGHGQSGGSRVHVESFHHYIQDVFQHLDMMKKKYPDLPIFLCGHSMGGAISILTSLERPEEIQGIVLMSPAVKTNDYVVTPFKKSVARILRRILPHFPVGTLDYSMACSCPKGLKTMLEDPLMWHGFCKASFGSCLVDATDEIQKKLSDIIIPFILLQAEDDKLIEVEGAKLMHEKASSKDKVLKIYPKAYHNLLMEPNGIAEQVTKDIVDWLNVRA